MIVVVEGSKTTIERVRVGRVTVYSVVAIVSGEGTTRTVNANVVRIELDGRVVASAEEEGAVQRVLLAIRTDYAVVEVVEYERLSIYTKA
jgi:hypothetical protein